MQVRNPWQKRLAVVIVLQAVLFSFAVTRTLAQETDSVAQDQALAEAQAKAEQAVSAQAPAAPQESTRFSPQELSKIETAQTFRQDVQQDVAIRGQDYPFNMQSYVRFMPKVEVNTQDGSVAITDAAAEWSYEHKFFGRLPVEFSMEQSYININNSTVVKIPSRLTGIGFGLDVTLPLLMLEKMYFRIGVTPSFYTDNWSLYENSLRLPQRYFAIWQPNDKFTAILGMAVYPRFRDVFLPIAGIIYKPNDKWLFNLVPSRPTINYTLNDKIAFFGEYSMSGGEYVVTKDGNKGTPLNYDEQHAGVGLEYTLNKYVQGSLAVGGAFARKLQYRESYGKVDIKNGFYTEFRVNVDM